MLTLLTRPYAEEHVAVLNYLDMGLDELVAWMNSFDEDRALDQFSRGAVKHHLQSLVGQGLVKWNERREVGCSLVNQTDIITWLGDDVMDDDVSAETGYGLALGMDELPDYCYEFLLRTNNKLFADAIARDSVLATTISQH